MATDETRIEHGQELTLAHADVTKQIIGAAFEVHRLLGYGFLEKVYQRALQTELGLRGMIAELEPEIRVQYKGVDVGYYKADLLVQGCVIVEVKVAKAYNSDDEAQLLNELKARCPSRPTDQFRTR